MGILPTFVKMLILSFYCLGLHMNEHCQKEVQYSVVMHIKPIKKRNSNLCLLISIFFHFLAIFPRHKGKSV